MSSLVGVDLDTEGLRGGVSRNGASDLGAVWGMGSIGKSRQEDL